MPTTLGRTSGVLRRAVDTGQVPGLIAAVDRPGTAPAVHVLGDDSTRRALRRDTIVRIASITKPITAVSALSLAEDGAFDLDEPVARWLPELARSRVLAHEAAGLGDTVPAERAITVADVLSYRCGAGMLPRPSSDLPIQQAYAGLGGDGPPGSCPLPGPDDWLARLAALPLIAQPGRRWLHQTSGDLLGVLPGRVCGTDLGTVLRDRMFTPLGMRDTGFHAPAAERHRFVPQLAPRPRWRVHGVRPGGRRLGHPTGLPLRSSRTRLHGGRSAGVRPGAALGRGPGPVPRLGRRADHRPAHSRPAGRRRDVPRRRRLGRRPVRRTGWSLRLGRGLGTGRRSDPATGTVDVLLTQVLRAGPEGPGLLGAFRAAAHS